MVKEINEKYKAILIFGAPGAGKGTQAKLISNDKRYFHFSTGEMFRNLKHDKEMKDTGIAKKVNELISGGNFVPDNMTIELFFKTLEQYQKQNKYNPNEQILILDGIPRNTTQVDLIKNKIDVTKIIYLYASKENSLLERLIKRAIVEKRDDDKAEVIKKRLEIYKKDTEAVIGKYSPKIILKIDALPKIEKVYQEILKQLK